MMATAPTLDSLRAEIDQIDDTLHTLLMRRAEVSEQVRAAKGARPILFRPGREAAILKRLLSRHGGALPPEAIVQIWREIIAASTRLQGRFVVAVFAASPTELDLARAQFGVLTPLLPMSSIGPVLAALEDGQAQLGVLPLPEDTPDEPWWRGCGGSGEDALQILARLPFAATALQPSALIVGRQAFEPTGDDRGYVVLETDGDFSRARLAAALTKAGLTPRGFPAEARVADGRGAARPLLLVETEDYVGPGDKRLESLREAAGPALAAARPIGGYAVPIQLGRPRTRK
jgi:chorismate mutase / prephenate dehydratase